MRQSTERQWNGWSLAWGLMVATSRSVDVVSVSVVDLGGVEVRVGDVVVDLVVMDGAIEWISEWIVVDVLGTRSNSWVVVLGVVVVLLSFVRDVWTDNHVELVLITAISTLGQEESPGEAKVSLVVVDGELSVAVQSSQNLLVQLPEACTVILVEVVLVGVALDDVLTRFQLVLEVIELNKVETVLADVEVSAIFVIFGSQIDPDDGLLFLV
jgi:hypothetical protein